MSKATIMNFADGAKEIRIGMEVVYGNGQGQHHYRLTTTKVQSIGRKYATMENGDQFYFENGHMKTQFVSGALYSSKVEYDFAMIKNKLIDSVAHKVRHHRFTYEEAKKVAEVLDFKLEDL